MQILDSDESGGLSCTEFCNAIKKLVLTPLSTPPSRPCGFEFRWPSVALLTSHGREFRLALQGREPVHTRAGPGFASDIAREPATLRLIPLVVSLITQL